MGAMCQDEFFILSCIMLQEGKGNLLLGSIEKEKVEPDESADLTPNLAEYYNHFNLICA
jgi:hypothetical protein